VKGIFPKVVSEAMFWSRPIISIVQSLVTVELLAR